MERHQRPVDLLPLGLTPYTRISAKRSDRCHGQRCTYQWSRRRRRCPRQQRNQRRCWYSVEQLCSSGRLSQQRRPRTPLPEGLAGAPTSRRGSTDAGSQSPMAAAHFPSLESLPTATRATVMVGLDLRVVEAAGHLVFVVGGTTRSRGGPRSQGDPPCDPRGLLTHGRDDRWAPDSAKRARKRGLKGDCFVGPPVGENLSHGALVGQRTNRARMSAKTTGWLGRADGDRDGPRAVVLTHVRYSSFAFFF